MNWLVFEVYLSIDTLVSGWWTGIVFVLRVNNDYGIYIILFHFIHLYDKKTCLLSVRDILGDYRNDFQNLLPTERNVIGF